MPIAILVTMDRPVNFDRERLMRCGECGHEWLVDLDWLERWDCTQEACPTCGTNCESETGARVTVDRDDPALDDNVVYQFDWYHTSTSADWPATPDFATHLTDETKMMIGGEEAAARWAEGQSTKALHIGTYEAAIHNMLRRADSQRGRSAQFYLYRVRLDSTAPVAPDWVIDPSNFVGDVHLEPTSASFATSTTTRTRAASRSRSDLTRSPPPNNSRYPSTQTPTDGSRKPSNG